MTKNKLVLGLMGIVVMTVLPFFISTYYVFLLSLIYINIIIAIGLNLLTGNSGQISLCHSSFVALGAYSFVLANNLLSLHPLVSVFLSVFFVSVVGFIVGFPARRLGGIYLALATLAFLSLVQICIEEFADLTGGIRGLKLEKPSETLYAASTTYLISLVFCVFAIYVAFQIVYSKIGRGFDAIRTSPYAAQALGISVPKTKLNAFVISASYGGLGGALLSWVVGYIDPVEFGVSASLLYITFIVIGGMGNIYGSIFGAIVLTILPEGLRVVKEYSDFVYAVMLLINLMFLPKGLISLFNARSKSTL